jgi:hypothetical protein
MNKISKFSALVAVLAATATFASADTIIDVGSYASSNPGFSNTAIKTSTTASATDPGGSIAAPTNSAVTITKNSAWTSAGSAGSPPVLSQWISFEAGTGAGPTVVAPNGYYSYYTTFTAGAGATGSIYVMADDTTAVYLNGTRIQIVAPGPNSICQTAQPNCTTPLLVDLTGLINGTNILVFSVEQTNLSSTGLDFYGTVDTPSAPTIPEPSTLLLLSTGLVGSAGALFRRMRS